MSPDIELGGTSDGVCWLRLNRPDRRNAWSETCGDELTSALLELERDPKVRCVVLTGAGSAFCAGVDLQDGFQKLPDGTPDIQGMHRRWVMPSVLTLHTYPKPVIAAVNGPAVGFGASLALAPDLTLMAESAYLQLAFVRLGLSPDGGITATLPARAGRQRAMAAMLLGDRITAEQAERWGIVYRAVPDQELLGVTQQLALRLANGPTLAYAAIKRAMSAQQPALAEQLEVEGALSQSLTRTSDFTEGVAAYRERRAPGFTGS